MERIKAAVIGIGNMGTAHAQSLWEGRVTGLTLAAVCDTDPARLAYANGAWPGVACYAGAAALLAGGGVQAAIVAVPHPLHSKIAGAALEAGLHVLVEKPLDVRLSAAQALCRQAKERGRVFALMLNQRTNPLFARAREIVQCGELGQLKRSVWIVTNWYRTQHYYDSGAWRATWADEGGGVLLNQAPHNLDIWQWICGMPASVTGYCDVARYHHIEVEDDATIFARYANGATGVFITSTGEMPGTNRLEIAGTKGKLVLENGVLKWWRLRIAEDAIRFSARDSFAAPECAYQEITSSTPETAHTGIFQNFVDAILHGTPLLSPGEDGLKQLAISNAAYLSQWTGNAAVPLPPDTALFDMAYQSTVSRIKQHPIGKRKLKTVTADHLQAYMDLLSFGGTNPDGTQAKALSVGYIRLYSAVLQNSFRFAVFPKRLITFNPMQYVVRRSKCDDYDLFESGTDQEGAVPTITYEQYQSLTAFLKAKNNPALLPIQIAYYTGLRIGEVCGLTWQDIDLKEQCLTVRRSMRYNGTRHKLEVGATKRKKIRTVDFCNTLADILQQAKREQARNSLKYGALYRLNYCKEVKEKNRTYYEVYMLPRTEATPETDKCLSFVCLRPDGAIESPSTVGLMCRRAKEKVPGLEDFHFHMLRHTFTSNLLSYGAAPKDVQELLGHSDVNTTMNIYAHATREAKRSSARLLDKVVSSG